MAIAIEMPKLSDTMVEGTLLKWCKQEGDTISVGDIIAEIQTDKATMEMEAFDDGILAKILIQEGGVVPVKKPLAILAEEGEDPKTLTIDDIVAEVEEIAQVEEKQKDSTTKSGGSPINQSGKPAITSEDGVQLAGDPSTVKSSPLARKIALAKGVDITLVTGTGPGGRIVKGDVELAALRPKVQVGGSSGPTPVPSMPAGKGDSVRQPSIIQSIAIDRLTTSKQTIPHFYLRLEADVTRLMQLRKQINSQVDTTHGNKFTVNDFVLKAVVEAIKKAPVINSSYDGASIITYKDIGLSFAVSAGDDLVTPVIQKAQLKSLLQISQEAKELVKKAQINRLHPKDFEGGTITVSNLGAWGIESFDAIVSPPQAAILAVGAAIEKPVIVQGEVVTQWRMNITLSCDHRVVDGAAGADFLNAVKRMLEAPSLMLM